MGAVELDWGKLADPDYTAGVYRTRQLLDAAAFGLGIARTDEGPTGAALDESNVLRASLRAYTRAAWPILEPAKRFVPGWHLDAVAEHLEAVGRGEIKRLIINVPPGTMKSLSVSVLWMTFDWATNPWRRWLFLTHDIGLGERDSRKCRDLILSPWYQGRWGHLYQLSPDQQTKVNFENNRKGNRLAKTMSGSRGHGGDMTVIDDPHDTRSTVSDVMRDETIRTYDEEISSRLRDMRTGAAVLMMQRLHQQDLTGHILDIAEPGHWTHLMLPMRFDPARRCVTVLGFQDPRQTPGEWLWPEFFPPDSPALKELEKTLGPYGVAGQWQQNPIAREGGQFERGWFLTDYDKVPNGSKMVWVRAWDAAGTQDGGAYTCGLLMGLRITDGLIFIKHVIRGQWGAGVRNGIIKATAQNDAQPPWNKSSVFHLFEQEGGSGGKDQAKSFMTLLRGFRADYGPSTGDKFTRADPFSGACKNGDVHVLPGPWREDYLDEMEAAGPGAAYLDQMDCSSLAYNWLMSQWEYAKATGGVGINLELLDGDELTRESPWLGVNL